MSFRSSWTLALAVAGIVGAGACSNDTLSGEPRGDSFVPAGDPLFAPGDDFTGDTSRGDDAIPPGDEDLPEACKFYGIDFASTLWLIDPLVPSVSPVGNTGVSNLTDIAILDDGRMIAHTQRDVYRLSPSTGLATVILEEHDSVTAFSPVASDGHEGRLLVGGTYNLGWLDADNGTIADLGQYLPIPWEFAGDIAMVSDTSCYATAKADGEADHLFFLDTVNHIVEDRGSLGTDLVWGLDYGCDGILYGLVSTNPLRVISIDPATAVVTTIGSVTGPTSLWGAAGPAGY